MLSDDNADKKEMQKSGNSANSLNVNNDRRKPSEIIDILPVKYEFVFENKEPIQQIKAIHSLKEILTEQDFNLIKSKIAPEIYLKIDKHN